MIGARARSLIHVAASACYNRTRAVRFCITFIDHTVPGVTLKDHIESYEGGTENGEWHGKGTVIYKDGSTFDGTFSYGKMVGRGILVNAEGKTHVGDYKKNKIWNGSGIAHLSTTSKYEGEVVNGRFEGKGKYYNDKYRYEGEWKAGFYHGRGLEVHTDNSTYAGFFVQGKRHGMGIHMTATKITYRGEFKNGLRHGAGTVIYPNGKTFKGTFAEGKVISGSGYYELHSESLTRSVAFEGEWVNGERAEGKYIHFDSSISPDVKAAAAMHCTRGDMSGRVKPQPLSMDYMAEKPLDI